MSIAGYVLYFVTTGIVMVACAYAAISIGQRRYGSAGLWIAIGLVNFSWLFVRALNQVWDHPAVVEVVMCR